MPRRILLSLTGAVAVAAVLSASAWAGMGAPGLRSSVMPTQSIALTIRPAAGAAHGEHVTTPSFAVEPGLPVHLTFTNYTRQAHTFTVPGLGISVHIRSATGAGPATTRVTLTPHAYGVFDWACLLCPEDGSAATVMKGKIYAIVQA